MGTAPSVYRALIFSLLDYGCQELECAPVFVLSKYCNIQNKEYTVHILLINVIHIMCIKLKSQKALAGEATSVPVSILEWSMKAGDPNSQGSGK